MMKNKTDRPEYSNLLEFKEKLVSALSGLWHDLYGDGSSCDWKNLKIIELRGQGATSKQFLILVPLLPNGVRKFFVKKYTSSEVDRSILKNQLKKEYAVSQLLMNSLETSGHFQVIKPYFLILDDLILVSDFVQGQNLNHLFFKALRFSRISTPSLTKPLNLVQKIGYGLTELQAISLDRLNQLLGYQTPEKYLAELQQSLDEIVQYLNRTGYFNNLVNRGQRIIEYLILDTGLKGPLCFQHGDFILQNFLIDGRGQLSLFDFPHATIGMPYYDAADFISSIEDLSYLRTVSEKCIHRLIKSFLVAFDKGCKIDLVVLDGFRLYFQYLSTMMIFKSVSRRNGVLRSFFFESALDRFNRRVPALIKAIEEGKGELAHLIESE